MAPLSGSPVARDAPQALIARSSNLSKGAKAGVSVGCIVGASILLCILYPFLARAWRRWRGKDKPVYHPSQDDPTASGPNGPERTDTRNLPDVPEKPSASSEGGGEQGPASEPSPTEQSPFDPNLEIPPHYRDEYIAYQERKAREEALAALPSAPAVVAPGQVGIDAHSSRFGQFKDNARNKLQWSTEKAQFLKKALKDKSQDGKLPADATPRIHHGNEPSIPNGMRWPWFSSISQQPEAGPSSKAGAATLEPSQPPPGLVSPGISPRMSSKTSDHHGESPFLTSNGTGLPSPPLFDQETGDPKKMWCPTNNYEMQDMVRHQLDMLETSPPPVLPTTDSPTSSSPQPVNDDFIQTPHIEPLPPLPQDPDQPSTDVTSPKSPQITTPQFTTPQMYDTEMLDVISDFSTPHDRMFHSMSNQGTPYTQFTDSEVTAASPKSNRESELEFTSPAPFSSADRNTVEPSNPESPPAPSPAPYNSDEAQIDSPHSYTCDECGKSFEQIHRLNHHKRYHERKHECTEEGCNKKFGTKTHLDRHINDKHKKTRKFYCTEPTCPYSIQGGKSFPRKDNWVRHIRKKHRNLSINRLEAQGFLIDEEAGTTQSVAAPPSQQEQRLQQQQYAQGIDMPYGMPLNIPMSLATPGMGGHPNPQMGMQNGMHHGMDMGMNGMGGANMNMSHPPMPPGSGFNSQWNMGHNPPY